MTKKEEIFLKSLFRNAEIDPEEVEETRSPEYDDKLIHVMKMEAEAVFILRRMARSKWWNAYYCVRSFFEKKLKAIGRFLKSIYETLMILIHA